MPNTAGAGALPDAAAAATAAAATAAAAVTNRNTERTRKARAVKAQEKCAAAATIGATTGFTKEDMEAMAKLSKTRKLMPAGRRPRGRTVPANP